MRESPRFVRGVIRAARSGAAVVLLASLAGLACGPRPSATSARSSAARGATGAPPNLLLYIVDTLRADHLGCYGYSRPTSPAIDAFARRGVLFRAARAQSSWTRPTVATLLTGLYPVGHAIQRLGDQMPRQIVTLAERLQAAGWQTAMVTTNGNASGFGLRQGFDGFFYLRERHQRPTVHVRSTVAHARALRWLDGRDPRRPFFLVVHSTDPHDPYTPAPEFRLRFAPDAESSVSHREIRRVARASAAARARAAERWIGLYDGEIAENDASFGALLAELGRRGLDDETAIVFTADHGEEFLEHGQFSHGKSLYEELLHVPLVVVRPGEPNPGTTVDAWVEQVDVAPTLLALAGLPPAAELPGRDLLGPGRADRASFAWLERPQLSMRAVAHDGWKLIENRAAPKRPPRELYSLAADPGERDERAEAEPQRADRLARLLAAAAARFGTKLEAETAPIDPELRKTLEALGYL